MKSIVRHFSKSGIESMKPGKGFALIWALGNAGNKTNLKPDYFGG
jgi:hypothetical protein